MEFILTKKNFKKEEYPSLYQDIFKIHEIRGRLLNLSTILEMIMKEYLDSKGITYRDTLLVDYKNKRNGIFDKFLIEIKKNQNYKRRIKSFEKHFRFIIKHRNNFAHGIIYYKNPKKSVPNKINNSVYNKKFNFNESLNKKNTIFNKLNISYKYILDWLIENKLFKLDNFCIIKANSLTDFKKI